MQIGSTELFKIIQESQITLVDVGVAVTLAFALGLIISQVYKKTFRGISYSQSFVTSITLLTPITAIVMLTIGSNLARAFGLVGALSIIRFRTVVKDTKDIMIIFLSLVMGLSVGTMNYHIAILGTLLISLFILILDRTNYGLFNEKSFLVTFSIPQNQLNEQDYKDIVEKYPGRHELLNISTVDKDLLEITYKLEGTTTDARQDIVKELRELDGVKDITLVSTNNFIEY